MRTLLIVSCFFLLPLSTAAQALELCAKADTRGPDPTAPKNNSPIKLRTACKPVKEVSLGTTGQLAALQSLDLDLGNLQTEVNNLRTEINDCLDQRWGSRTSSLDSAQIFTFNTAFNSGCSAVFIQRNTAGSTEILPVTGFTRTGFTIDRNNDIDGSHNFWYFAVGY